MYSLEIKLPQAYVRPYVRLGIKNHSSMQYVACARTINLMINCFWHIESLAACLQLAALLTNEFSTITESNSLAFRIILVIIMSICVVCFLIHMRCC